ncbi:DUF1330 domain-containing protein [Parvibaculum sedimenti]|uniref:DUF1330 domain-containing protein n=1 Tax=Parvibaculum sedimenti TaxID=2608632 RepID=A0A6N6VH56_9HYPH|nr:DUF1330 domain-containing protein [Parvibaculum sedimenti]KAB7739030.1 DUF1330 domain-containing protein [Parvibaculum sedimenti]
MNYEIAVYPKREKLMGLAGSQDTAPIVMLNLLKFHDVAQYKDGRAEKISGREAYMRYATEMEKIVAANGGRFLFFADLKDVVIGEVGDLWDEVGLVEYASAASFAALVTSPEVLALSNHREAGLAGQLLIRSTLAFEPK